MGSPNMVETMTRPRREDPSAAPPALTVDHLTKQFGQRIAFQDVSFTVAAGEVFGFLGPNGAGKTTTVRTLGTLIAPTSGSASVAGIPLTSDNGPEIRQRIAIMPENPGLYRRLTVTENHNSSRVSTSSATPPLGSARPARVRTAATRVCPCCPPAETAAWQFSNPTPRNPGLTKPSAQAHQP